MLSIRSAALAALILALGVVEGFVPVDGSKSSVFVSAPLAMCPGGEKNNDDDPTKVWYAGVADAVQNVLTNSPLNEGKKALVKSLAGDYDVEATQFISPNFQSRKPLKHTTIPPCSLFDQQPLRR